MKTKKMMAVVALIFLVVIIGASVLYRQLGAAQAAGQLSGTEEEHSAGPEASVSQEPVDAPDFTVYDQEGNAVNLSDYAGKPVVLNFWASWCPPCKSEMPDFHAAYEELGEEVQFLMVNATDGSRETVDTAASFIQEQGYTFPVFYDTQSEASMAYGAYSLPMTFFINEEGHVAAYARGAISEDILRQGIDMIHTGA